MPPSAAVRDLEFERETEGVEFVLAEEEVAKGAEVVTSFLGSIKVEGHRQAAGVALDKLALLITAGRCEAMEFPWHQLEGHHGATALALLKEEGVPETIERYMCARDRDRKLLRTPSVYPSREIQKIRNALRKVLNASTALGHVDPENPGRAAELLTPAGNTVLRGRMLTAGEFRALLASCDRDKASAGKRDSLIFHLGFEGGLRLGEMLGTGLGDIEFDQGSGRLAVKVRGTRGVKARTVPLSNDAMIVLEDWLEKRGRQDGPLLCPVGRGGRVEVGRLKGVDLRLACTRRAQEAGVELFSPQDLRRRVAAGDDVERAPAVSNLLFGEVDSSEEIVVDRISFPYPARNSE